MLDRIRSYFSYILKKRKDSFICNSCGFEIPVLCAYYENEHTGEILCTECFQKKVMIGEIKI